MSELATLAPEVDASLVPAIAPATAPGVTDALEAVLADLRAEMLRCEAADGADAAHLLATLVRQLEQPRGWHAVDRLVHELLCGVVVEALGARDEGPVTAAAARAFALRTIARHAALWPGAGPRHGCAYGYDNLLATIRLTALTA